MSQQNSDELIDAMPHMYGGCELCDTDMEAVRKIIAKEKLRARLDEARQHAYRVSADIAKLFGYERMSWEWLLSEGYVDEATQERISELQAELKRLEGGE